jgi:VIT1/CCC1 family predicted Fe2+/Mn2+ transporter
MPQTPHIEKHFTASETVRDIVIGMSDGLTVPFALAAGLTGAVAASKLVVTAGLAEVAAGSIAMGLGGFLAARGDAEHFAAELAREQREIVDFPDVERAEVREILENYGVPHEQAAVVVESLAKDPDAFADFMMKFELGLEKPDPKRAFQSAFSIAGAYIVGGVIPLSPYFMYSDAHVALPYSVALTIAALAIFGYIKGHFTGTNPIKSALQTSLIGGLAAAAAFGIARLLEAH